MKIWQAAGAGVTQQRNRARRQADTGDGDGNVTVGRERTRRYRGRAGRAAREIKLQPVGQRVSQGQRRCRNNSAIIGDTQRGTIRDYERAAAKARARRQDQRAVAHRRGTGVTASVVFSNTVDIT